MIFRVGAFRGGSLIDWGEGFFESTRPDVYHILTKVKEYRIFPKKKLQEKTTLMYFDPNANKDGTKEGKVTETNVSTNSEQIRSYTS